MLNGIIFVSEAVISLDLKVTLSKYYRIVNTFRNTEDLSVDSSDIDFIIIDTDPFSEQELRSVLDKLNMNKEIKIISLSSFTSDPISNKYNHRHLTKPYNNQNIIEVIERS